jgi:hypothetical protein
MAKLYRRICFGCNTWICNDQKTSKAINLVYGMSEKYIENRFLLLKVTVLKWKTSSSKLIFPIVHLNVYLTLTLLAWRIW